MQRETQKYAKRERGEKRRKERDRYDYTITKIPSVPALGIFYSLF